MKPILRLFVLLFGHCLFSQITISQGITETIVPQAIQVQCGSQPLTVGMQGRDNYFQPVIIFSALPVNQMTIPIASLGGGSSPSEIHRFDAEGITNEVVSVSPGCSSSVLVSGNTVSNINPNIQLATSITIYSPSKFTTVKVTRQQGSGVLIGPFNTVSTSSNELSTMPDSGVVPEGLNSTAVENVLFNDFYYSQAATLSNVSLSFLTSTHPGITLETQTGKVNVASSVPQGNYTLTYRICSIINPNVCLNEVVSIKVNPGVMTACWKDIGISNSTAVAIHENGTLWSWGYGNDNLLGDGTSVSRNYPVQISTATNWDKIIGSNAASCKYICAIKTDGTLWVWGSYIFGSAGSSNVPVQVGTANDWKTAAIGQEVGVFIKNDGSIWVLGWSTVGQLGLGSTVSTFSGGVPPIGALQPVQIGTETTWKSVSVGSSHVLALKNDGTLWTWGYCPGFYHSVPTQISSDIWSAFSAGSNSSTAIKSNGTLWFWGSNGAGLAGNGTQGVVTFETPTQIGTATNWKSVSTSSRTIATKTDNTLWAWGYNYYRSLGNGTNIDYYFPQQVGSYDWDYVVNHGNNYSVARKTNGNYYIAGDNLSGIFGNGTNQNTSVFTQITNCIPPQPVIANDDTGTISFGSSGIAVANVLQNDTHYGSPISVSNYNLSLISSSNANLILNTSNGTITVTSQLPVGSYTLVYQVCENMNPLNCDTATVTICVFPVLVAANDSFTIDCPGANLRSVNVRNPNPSTPDTYNGSPLTANATIKYIQTPNSLQPIPSSGAISIGIGGGLVVDLGTPAGNYQLKYKIQYLSGNCTFLSNEATVNVIVSPSKITSLTNDTGSGVFGVASTPIVNVLSNDNYIGNVEISQVSSSSNAISLNTTTGAVQISAQAAVGVHTLQYTVCNLECNFDCKTATATVNIPPPPPVITAVNDTGIVDYSISSVRTAVSNVLSNDTVNSNAATLANITLTQVSVSFGGIYLNTNTGAITVNSYVPEGTYYLVYKICELGNTTNCSTATVTVIVRPVVLAVNDSPVINYNVGSPSLINVLTNDKYNFVTPTASNTTLTFVSSTHNGITLNTATGALGVLSSVPSGTYTLVYTLCSLSNPSVCSTATVTINVNALIYTNQDSGQSIFSIGGLIISTSGILNVLNNDTFNGQPATFSNVTLSFISSTNPGITLNTLTGQINVLPSVPLSSGIQTTYQLTYKICRIGSTSNCATGVANITVYPKLIALDDNISVTKLPNSMATSVSSVLTNDSKNDISPLQVNNYVNLSKISSSDPGINLDLMQGRIYVAYNVPIGNHYLTYKISWGSINPEVSSTATAYITVTGNKTTVTDSVDNIVVSPNPSQGIFTVGFGREIEEESTLLVYDMLGQLISKKTIIGVDSCEIDLSDFPTATYILKILSEKESVTKILIKE